MMNGSAKDMFFGGVLISAEDLIRTEKRGHDSKIVTPGNENGQGTAQLLEKRGGNGRIKACRKKSRHRIFRR